MTGQFVVEGFTEYYDDDSSLTFQGVADIPLASDQGGQDCGRVLIRLSVDEQFTHVSTDLGGTGDIAALMAASDALHRTIARLTDLYPTDVPQSMGQCLAINEVGRCRAKHGHDTRHAFPTSEQIHAEEASFRAALGRKG